MTALVVLLSGVEANVVDITLSVGVLVEDVCGDVSVVVTVDESLDVSEPLFESIAVLSLPVEITVLVSATTMQIEMNFILYIRI